MPSTSNLGIILITRTTLNSSIRIVYPFLPAISRGLGVSLTEIGFLVTVRSFVGLSAPIFGRVTDRHGRRNMMLVALFIMVSAALLVRLSARQSAGSSYFLAIIAFGLFGLAKATYDPAVQAFLGELIPYSRRGRIWGIIELSWVAAWLLGLLSHYFV